MAFDELLSKYEDQLDSDAIEFASLYYEAGEIEDAACNMNFYFLQFLLKTKLLTNVNSINTLRNDNNYKSVISLYNQEHEESVSIIGELQFATALQDIHSSPPVMERRAKFVTPRVKVDRGRRRRGKPRQKSPSKKTSVQEKTG